MLANCETPILQAIPTLILEESGGGTLSLSDLSRGSALLQHQGNTSRGIELWVTSSCARLGHIIVPPPCTMGSSAVVALGHSTYQTRPRAARAVTHQIRGQRESNFQVDTISILIVATIVDIDIEIDIDIINRRC